MNEWMKGNRGKKERMNELEKEKKRKEKTIVGVERVSC